MPEQLTAVTAISRMFCSLTSFYIYMVLETATFAGLNPYVLMEHDCDSVLDQTVGHSFFHENTITSAVYVDILENFVFPQIVV
jgi:hypothetical protein